jgi:hypothetical protein
MINKMNIALMRKYTTRINLLFAVAFVVTLTMSFADYEKKLLKDPQLPWYAMFLKVPEQHSWAAASPFKS